MPRLDTSNCHKSRMSALAQFFFAPGIFDHFNPFLKGQKAGKMKPFDLMAIFPQLYLTGQWNGKKESRSKSSLDIFFCCLKIAKICLKLTKNLKSVKMSQNGHFLTSKLAYLLHFLTNFNETFWRGQERHQPNCMHNHGRVEGLHQALLQEVAEGPDQVHLRQVQVPAGEGRQG